MEWGFFIIMPVIFILLLGGGTQQSQDQRIQLYTVDLAQSSLSASLISELEQSSASSLC